jgi:hypothetical protein
MLVGPQLSLASRLSSPHAIFSHSHKLQTHFPYFERHHLPLFYPWLPQYERGLNSLPQSSRECVRPTGIFRLVNIGPAIHASHTFSTLHNSHEERPSLLQGCDCRGTECNGCSMGSSPIKLGSGGRLCTLPVERYAGIRYRHAARLDDGKRDPATAS